MRAYLAIIKDSFREALASRVLWILLILTTVALVGLALLGITELSGTRIKSSELHLPEFVAQLKSGQQASSDNPAKRLFSMLSPELQARVLRYQPPKQRGRSANFRATMLAELNPLLERRDLYSDDSWTGIELSSEAQDLLEQGLERLSQHDLGRFNRQAVQAAFPGGIEVAKPERLQLSYPYIGTSDSFDADKKEVVTKLLTLFVDFFVGTIGIFVATLVTASIVPNTFEAGAIDLLLSKPVSRSLVYFTKWLGGCMFTFVNAAYVLVGVWLICGLRYGIWSDRLLLCIPVFMFLFAIYYSVSAFVGVIWRNPIICVALTILFWAACFSIGFTKQVVDAYMLDPKRIIKMAEADGDLFAVNQSANFMIMRAGAKDWEESWTHNISLPPLMPVSVLPTPLGPVYDSQNKRVMSMEPAFPQFGDGGAAREVLLWGKAKDGYARRQSLSVPGGTSAMFMTPEHELVVVGPRGIFKLEGDPEKATEVKPVKILGYQLPTPKSNVRFVEIGPPLPLNSPTVSAMDAVTGTLAIYEQQHLRVLVRTADGKYELTAEKELEDVNGGVLACGGNQVMLATVDGWIRFYSMKDLSLIHEHQPKGLTAPRFAAASPDGRWFAALFHNRELWLYDTVNQTQLADSFKSTHGISAIHFPDNQRLLAVDLYTRLTEYQLEPFTVKNSRRGPMSGSEIAGIYLITPLYTVFPKPGELGNVVSYLLTESDSEAVGDKRNLEGYRATVDIWSPIFSNLAFIVVMVGLGCLYTHYKDF